MVVVEFCTSRKLAQRQGTMKPYCSGALLSFYALSTILTFAFAFICRFPRFFTFLILRRAFRFPWWRKTMSSDLISLAGSWWSTPLSPSCVFLFRFNIGCFVTLRTSIPELNKVYQRFEMVVIRGQVVC